MMGRCAIRASNSRFLGSGGSVPSVLTMTCVQSAITLTSTLCAIGLPGLRLQGVNGN
jgi:hypothetical protein